MTYIQSCVFYASVCVLSLLCCRRSEVTGGKLGAALAVLVLSLAAGLRAYSVGTDTASYQMGVEYFFEHNEVYWSVSFAFGYGVFSKAVLLIWHNYSFLLFMQALITNGLVVARLWDFRRSSSLTFMLFVYLTTFYFYTFNLICQSVAVAIAFYSMRFLDADRPVLYVVGVLIASCLHISALISLLAALFKYIGFKGVSRRRAQVQMLILLALGLGLAVAAVVLYRRYVRYYYTRFNGSAGLMVLAWSLVLLGSLLAGGYFSKPKDKKQAVDLRHALRVEAPHSLRLYVASIVLSASSYFISNAGRISYYFTLYGAVCYGAVAKRSGTSKECFVCTAALVVWLVFYCVYVFFLNDSGALSPYAFFWM